MLALTALLAGAVLALGLVAAARRLPPRGEHRLYAIGLLAAALVYVVLAARVGAPGRWTALELAGVIGFGAAAWLSVRRRRPWLLAAGWAAHVLWDVLLHLGDAAGAAYTPAWYAWLCASFDLVIAAALLPGRRRR